MCPGGYSGRAGIQHPVQLRQLTPTVLPATSRPARARRQPPQACRHHCADRSNTRSSAAISAAGTRRRPG